MYHNLKACPFCGSQNLTVTRPPSIECRNCGSTGPEARNPRDLPEATRLWNRRADSASESQS